MPFVLTTDNPTDGDAYWGPAGGGGGLADWSEDGDGNLYPNNDATQDLGLPTNRVDRFFGVQTILSVGDQPTVYPGVPTTVQSVVVGGATLEVEGGALTGVTLGGTGVVGRNRSLGGIVAGFASSSTGDPAFLYGGPAAPTTPDPSPCLVLGLAYADSGLAAVTARNGGVAIGRAFSAYSYGGSIYAGNHSVSVGLAFDSTTSSGTIVAAAQSMAFGQAHGGFIGVSGDTSLAFGYVYESTIQVQGGSRGCVAWGYAADNGSIFVSGFAGSFAGGYARGGGFGSAATIRAVNEGAFAFGAAFGNPGTGVYANGLGSTALGSVYDGGAILSSGSGTLAGGAAGQYGLITTTSSLGALVWGTVSYNSSATAESDGAVVFGQALQGSQLRARGPGSLVFGSSYSLGYIATAPAARGGFAFGYAYGASIQVSGPGSFAGGFANNYDIQASGLGSMAFGLAGTAAIVASAANSAQFFPGTNSLTNSLKVGADDYGLRLIGDGVAGIRNGDLWCDGLDVFVFSGGAVRNLSNVP